MQHWQDKFHVALLLLISDNLSLHVSLYWLKYVVLLNELDAAMETIYNSSRLIRLAA